MLDFVKGRIQHINVFYTRPSLIVYMNAKINESNENSFISRSYTNIVCYTIHIIRTQLKRIIGLFSINIINGSIKIAPIIDFVANHISLIEKQLFNLDNLR